MRAFASIILVPSFEVKFTVNNIKINQHTVHVIECQINEGPISKELLKLDSHIESVGLVGEHSATSTWVLCQFADFLSINSIGYELMSFLKLISSCQIDPDVWFIGWVVSDYVIKHKIVCYLLESGPIVTGL